VSDLAHTLWGCSLILITLIIAPFSPKCFLVTYLDLLNYMTSLDMFSIKYQDSSLVTKDGL